MARLWLLTIASALLAILFYGGGCSRPGLDTGGDGGTLDGDGGDCTNGCPQDCRQLDEKSCLAAGSACLADYCYACSCQPSFVACRRPSDAQTTCPLYGCPQPICECNGLSEGACISAESSLGCSPSYCPDCKGGQYFTGCADPGGGGVCPASCPIETCHNDQECSNGQFCLAPGESAGCGACRVGTDCSIDSQCAAGEICGFDPCVCSNGATACLPGCSQTGCGEGETCANTNHCVPKWCQKPNDCPAQFDCNTNQCLRKSCSSDSTCAGGFCVKGQCYSTYGQCMAPVP